MDSRLKELFNSLDEDKEKLELRLRSLDRNLLNEPMEPGKWSVLQTLRHLVMAEQSSLIYVGKKLQDPSRADKSGLGSFVRGALLRGWFKLGMKAKAPKAFAEIPPDQDRDAVLNEYTQVRQQFRDLLETVPSEFVDRELFRHPMAGKMHLMDAIKFFRSHFLHHQKQIDRFLEHKKSGVVQHS